MVAHENLLIHPSDIRTRDMQIISPAAVNYGIRLWKTYPRDIATGWDDEYVEFVDEDEEGAS